jgi:hypothetical protein
LAVHCPPAVTVCTPGWMVAVAAGAHASALAGRAAATTTIAMSTRAFLNTQALYPVCQETKLRRASMLSRTYSSVSGAPERRTTSSA